MQDFERVVDGVQAWAQDTCQRLPSGEEQTNEHVRYMAHFNPRGVKRLQDFARDELDVQHAMLFPDTDEDILIALMMSALTYYVFNPDGELLGCTRSLTAMCREITEALATTVTKKRGTPSIRSSKATRN